MSEQDQKASEQQPIVSSEEKVSQSAKSPEQKPTSSPPPKPDPGFLQPVSVTESFSEKPQKVKAIPSKIVPSEGEES